MTEAPKGMPNWKAVGPDGLPAELLKIDHPAFAQCFHNILVNVWLTGEVPQQWKDAIIGATGDVAENPTKGMRRGGGTGGVEGKLR